MAFPSVASVTETSFATNTESHEVSMPATVNAGDLLIVLISLEASFDINTPSGWTQLYHASNGTFVRGAAYAKDAAGTEGGTTVDFANTNPNTSSGAAHVYRITGWDGTVGNVEAATPLATGSGTSVDPPSHTPTGGAQDYLWIATCHTGDDDVATTGFPTDYTDGVDTACGSGANDSGRVSSARRELNASSEDPGAFTLASSEAFVTSTISIPPGAVASDPESRLIGGKLIGGGVLIRGSLV